MDIKGTTWLITGASAGIGAAIVREAASQGAAHLVLTARRRDRMDQLSKDLTDQRVGLRVTIITADLGTAEGRAELLKGLGEQHIDVDVLVNNAGLGAYGLFEEIPWERTDAMVQVNVVALTELTNKLLPGMLQRRRGGIVNISSIAGLLPLAGMATYAATKAYVTSLTDALSGELGPMGISVVGVYPGPTSTEFHEVASRHDSGKPYRPKALFQTAEEVGRAAVDGLMGDQTRVQPGVNLVVGSLARMTPAWLSRTVGGRLAGLQRKSGHNPT